MGVPYNRLVTRIDLDRIAHNYAMLRRFGDNPAPVVKADAYGHGLFPVAKTLALAGAKTLCVGSVEEASALCGAYGGRVVALLGPLDMADARAVVDDDLVPMVYRFDQFDMLAEAAREGGAPVRLALKFDTGMGRLGFRPADAPALVGRLRGDPRLQLEIVASHLATADEPDNAAYVARQAGVFKDICAVFAAAGFVFERTLGNSAAMLAHEECRLDMQRPGIALYGANPFAGTALADVGKELLPAMAVSTIIAHVHDLAAGESVSYGCTFTADAPMRVAIAVAGYADCYSRSLSRRAEMVVRGRRARVLGRVCMQLTAIDVTDIPDVVPGDAAWLLGGDGPSPVTPEELAAWWGTITYEVFCLLGLNRREYAGG